MASYPNAPAVYQIVPDSNVPSGVAANAASGMGQFLLQSQHKAGATSFFTLQQIVVRHPGFTIRTQHGRRIYIDEGALLEWLEDPRS